MTTHSKWRKLNYAGVQDKKFYLGIQGNGDWSNLGNNGVSKLLFPSTTLLCMQSETDCWKMVADDNDDSQGKQWNGLWLSINEDENK